MKVCFVTKGSFYDFWETRLDMVGKSKIIVFGANGLGLVSYESELSSETEYFQDVARLSKTLGGVVVLGCDTDTYGAFRKSAIVADSGKLLGVSDAVCVSLCSEYTGGVNFTVYNTSVGKIGVLIGSDLYSVDAIKTLSLADADVVFCIFDKVDDFVTEVVIRAYSYLFGIPIALVGDGLVTVSSVDGGVAFSSTKQVATFDVNTDKVYGEVLLKKRGLSRYKR